VPDSAGRRTAKRNLRHSGSSDAPSIYVLAGTNGGGKSSIGGEVFLERGIEPFNPDEIAKRFRALNPAFSIERANVAAWQEGVRLLSRAITERLNFAFETTLGGRTITTLLERAAFTGIQVHIWYIGLRSPELHIQRVRARVAKGGHDIPEQKIRERYDQSRRNLIRLLPLLAALRLYDNSQEANPRIGFAPKPELILHFARKKVISHTSLRDAPTWTKPILMEALRLNRSASTEP
jgi:predicted ABC-type ATPase